MKGQRVVHASVKTGGADTWRTPMALFLALHHEWGFQIDAAADAANHLCQTWYGPGSPYADDALAVSWDRRRWAGESSSVWCNPPYSRCRDFVAKAAAERLTGVTSVLLVPSRTDTRWWHESVWDLTRHRCRPGVSVRFLKGRVRFERPDGSPGDAAPFPSCLVIFGGRVR